MTAKVFERILVMGVTGSGKSYQWLKLAEELLPTGSIFRCIDTDNAIPFMLQEHFPHLMPENGGNVYVHPAFDWPEYKQGIDWVLRKPVDFKKLEEIDPLLVKEYKSGPVKPIDWTIVDMVDNAWKTVQNYFEEMVFGQDPGDYFLQIRKEMEAGIRKTKKGAMPSSVLEAGLDGWRDWSTINKLYDDFIMPIIYRVKTHVYMTTKVERLGSEVKDQEVISLFGGMGIRPGGQKSIGHQAHSIFLFIPGKDKWFITTIKDRGDRTYFKKNELRSFYLQYLVAKARW